MHLLVVEDEPTLAGHLQKGLEEAAWTVEVAHTASDAWRLLAVNAYDLMLLDLGLPDTDGRDLLQRLRAAGIRLPVLVLTARSSLEDRVAGLNLGADDYLGKPFAFSELVARINALVRRIHHERSPTLQVGDLELDVARRQLRRGERRIELTAREFGVLELLMRHAGDVVTRTMLAEHVWGDHYDSLSNLIEVFINRLRRKIEADGASRLLHTVRGAGYVIREPSS
jgi:two-component system OmpR family response regulator